MKDIFSLAPQEVWKHFHTITAIPHPSHHEKAIVEKIASFASEKGLEYEIDKAGNIIVKKPATNAKIKKGVVLQAHVDMVPQKNNDTQHNFLTDPIETVVKGDWLYANGTTLGADNGIGVAAMLAVLDADDLQHGPIECLFTINEESGMDGAFGLSNTALKGEVLLNLDTEDEDEICMGCAGGVDANVALSYNYSNCDPKYKFYKISLKGLKGGHSGIDIHLGRGNSNKIMGRILYNLTTNLDIQLANYWGGNMRNAIPREAEAIICLPADNTAALLDSIQKYSDTLDAEFKGIEEELKLMVEETSAQENCLSFTDSKQLVSLMHACPNGVVRMSNQIPGLVETSVNLSIVKTNATGVEIQLLIRSAVDSAKYALGDRIRALFEMAGGEVDFAGDYPGWAPNNQSAILNVTKTAFTKLFNKEPHVAAVHAGLECGIIGGKYPNMDMVSFGPTIEHPHSPEEKVNIPSVGKFWILLKEVLEKVD